MYANVYRLRLVAELGGTDRNKNSVSHVWHHLRWNRQELGGTQVEHTCFIKIGGTKWNKSFIPSIPLPSFLQRPSVTSGDLLSDQIWWLWTCGGGGGGAVVVVVVVVVVM